MGRDPNLFDLIPVLDLLKGQVVRAVGGLRATYAPIDDPRLDPEDPEGVLQFLLEATGGRTAYVADLNAIQGGMVQEKLIQGCLQRVDSLWLDGGFTTLEDATTWATKYPKIVPVLGTESLREVQSLNTLPVVLSLDTGPEGRRGDDAWWRAPALWPDRVVVMNLNHVGRENGPDLEGLRSIRQGGFGGQIYAAGGVRGLEDIAMLRALGIHGALIASAIYHGTIKKGPA
jgi:phosphoribosylformimino-5-aminoimidazole carboxamide ribotide isomerase